jgi:hypothetical protein
MFLETKANGLAGQTALSLLPFREIWAVDFEFNFGGCTGNNPVPVCLVAWELRSGRKIRLWCDEFDNKPPYPTDRDVLVIAYYASAEMGCHLVLNWPVPVRILDLFAEFRNHTNGLPLAAGNGLVGAMTHFRLDSLGAEEKDAMRGLILRGGPWTEAEKKAILDYCESDVAALARLLPRILPHVDLQRALLRGRYMAAAARIEHNGVPIDVETLELLRRHWDDIQHAPYCGCGSRLRVKPGVPDVLVWYPGGSITIELKSRRGQCSRSQRAVREALLRAGAQWWVCRSANAAMYALYDAGVPFRTIIHEDGKIERWQQPKLPAWEVPKCDPHERRPRAPDYWEPEAAAEIVTLEAASDDAADDGIAASAASRQSDVRCFCT